MSTVRDVVAHRVWRGEESFDVANGEGLSVAVCTYCRPESLKRLLASVFAQGRRPEQVIVVDASPDERSECALAAGPPPAPRTVLEYWRVAGERRGLARQRNFALERAAYDVTVFLDDDVVLLPGCLAEMERVHRELGDTVAGVGARVRNQEAPPSLLWRLRRALGVVSTLQPGAYCRSGLSIPWDFLSDSERDVDGDWLPGCAMAWRTALARELGFHAGFRGYSNGEDLEFSLRAGRRGRLVVAGRAGLLHLHDAAGRPDAREFGYRSAANAHYIHRTHLVGRTRRDDAWFVYALTVDTLLRSLVLLLPRATSVHRRFLAGRYRFLAEIAWRRLHGRNGPAAEAPAAAPR